MRSEFEALLTDPAYREWFVRWWSADFSIDGCQKRNLDWRLGRPNASETLFADRRWGPGRLPPHDPDGNLNEAFFFNGWFDWDNYFRRYRHIGRDTFDLDGSWFERFDLGQGPPMSLGGSLSFVRGDLLLSSANAAKIRFRDAYVGGSLQLIDASITERAIFTRAIVGGDVVIRQVSGASVHLNRTRIRGSLRASDRVQELDISEAKIAGQLRWDASVRQLDALKTKIGGEAVLDAAQHATARVRMHRASLKSGFSINNAQVAQLELGSANIIGDLSITDCNIEKFAGSEMRVSGDFRQAATHINDFYLRHMRIGGKLDWRSCTFGDATLTETCIEGGTAIETCTFRTLTAPVTQHKGSASFVRTTFSDSVSFNGARFHGRTSFKGAAFRGRASFLKCHFEGSTSFAADREDMPGFVDGGAAFDAVTFQTSRFTASKELIWCVDFDGRQFEGASIFDGCHFFGSPRFFEVAFHEDASFRYTKFKKAPHPNWQDRWAAFQRHADIKTAWRATLNAWNKGQQQYEHAYRSLKLRMSEIGAAREERRFLALELRARRARLDQEVRFLERALSFIYDISSDYGEGIILPLFWTAIVTGVAAVAYHAAAPVEVDWLQALEFSVRQIFKPFNVWADGGALIVPAPAATLMQVLLGERAQGTSLGLGMKLVASAQSLACLTLLFLSALAIRKRFRLT